MEPDSLSKGLPRFLVSVFFFISVLFCGANLFFLLAFSKSWDGPEMEMFCLSVGLLLVAYHFFRKQEKKNPAKLSAVPTLILTSILVGIVSLLPLLGLISLVLGTKQVWVSLAIVVLPTVLIALLIRNYLRVRKKYQKLGQPDQAPGNFENS